MARKPKRPTNEQMEWAPLIRHGTTKIAVEMRETGAHKSILDAVPDVPEAKAFAAAHEVYVKAKSAYEDAVYTALGFGDDD